MAASKLLIFLSKVVGGTGIEPVTPTMSRFAAIANQLKYNEETTSKFADCSLFIHGNRGQSRPYRGRFALLGLALCLCLPTPGPTISTAADATALVSAAAQRHGVPVSFALLMARIESGIKCGVHNRWSSASGPVQVTRGTARAMGYRGNIRTASCATQTEYGMKALAMCWRASNGRPALARRCHQVGISAVYGRHR